MGDRRFLGWIATLWAVIFFMGAGLRVLADCSSFGLPFTDLGSNGFCAAIAEAYYTGITNGTSATTFSPNASVTRAQAAAFATRTLDAGLARGSRRAALGQWWTTTATRFTSGPALGVTTLPGSPIYARADGSDIWVSQGNGTPRVSRVKGSDGTFLGTWTGFSEPRGLLIAMGEVLVADRTAPGTLWQIDPTGAPGSALSVATGLGDDPEGVAFDGSRIWTANYSGSVSIITPGSWNVTNVTTGFVNPFGIVFDGSNMWITDDMNTQPVGHLLRLDTDGTILMTVPVGRTPTEAVFDGANIWVPNHDSNSVTVVRAIPGGIPPGTVIATLTGNGLDLPFSAAFDGERVLVTNFQDSVSLWRASDLSPLGVTPTGLGTGPAGACSDGQDFWIALNGLGSIGRF